MSHGELIWQSDFSDLNALRKDWNIEYAPPRKNNNEMQRYDNTAFKFDNQELNITTIKNGHDIKSGRINSRGKIEFQFGYIEALINFSAGPGLWPAFWLLGNQQGWPHCGEIDIMEYVNWNPNAVYGTLHGPNYCGGNAYGSGGRDILHKCLANEYHKYAIEWKPNYIKWFIDDIPYFTATNEGLANQKHTTNWVYNNWPFYIILNNACGGAFGGAKYNEQNIYNSLHNYNEMKIKYVKIYKTNDGQGRIINNSHFTLQEPLCIEEEENEQIIKGVCYLSDDEDEILSDNYTSSEFDSEFSKDGEWLNDSSDDSELFKRIIQNINKDDDAEAEDNK